MSTASRTGTTFAVRSALIVAAFSAGCSAPSSTPDVGDPNPVQSAPVATTPAAGTSGGAGRAPVATALANAGTAAAAAGRVGAPGDVVQGGSTAAAPSGGAKAGSGGQTGAAGMSVKEGGAGAGGQSVATAGASGAAGGSSAAVGCEVSPITDDMRSRYDNMDEDYYKKFASANGVIVGTGEKVSDEALIRYCRLLTEMVSNDKVREAVIADKMWFTMIDEDEQLSSLPQIARDYGTSLNQRARGLGGLTPTICAEDSIMCLPGDRWNGDCICPHEAGHTLYSSGIARVPDLSDRLTEITRDARSSGRLSNAYVWMDGNESGMMAWGVQVWYDCAINGTNGGYHSDINTRAELAKEMPEFHQFLSELMPADNQYKDCYAK